jgi:predicted neuraminidase
MATRIDQRQTTSCQETWTSPARTEIQNRIGPIIVVAAFLSVSPGATAVDFGVPISSPLPLNSNATSDTGRDQGVRITTFHGGGAGHWIAVWHSNENLGGVIGTDNDIFISRSTDRGATWTAITTLNTNASSDGTGIDRYPCLVTDGAGHWICAWESTTNLGGTIGTDYDIFVSHSINNGATWTAPATLNTNASIDVLNDFDIDIDTDGAGVWIAAWRSLDTLNSSIGPDADILFARSTDNGATWTFPSPLNTNAATDSGQDIKPHLATDGRGNWVAVWHSNETLGSTIGTDLDILFARSADNGMSWSTPQSLNSNAFTDNRDDLDVQIATDLAGQWIAVWTSEDSLGNTIGTDRDILVSRSSNNGATWSPAAPLNTNAASDTGADQNPQMATDGAGNWVVLWSSSQDLGGIGTDFDILASRSADDGATWSPPIAFNTNAGSDSAIDEFPYVATDGMGAWVGAWETRDSAGSQFGTDGDLLRARFALPDCNLNGIPDSTEPDSNGNGIPDDCDGPPFPMCRADIAPPPDGNGLVNIDDLFAVINAWGNCPAPPASCRADIAPPPNGNGMVNIDDLFAVINNWGPCP